VLVSHYRVLLERAVTDVLELHEHHRTAATYGGGWAAFQREKAAHRRNAETNYDEYQAERSRLRDRAQTQHEWSDHGVARAKRSSSDGDKHIRNRRIAQSEKRAAKARATDQALARLEPVEKPWEGWDLRYAMATTARSGDDVAELIGATASLGDFTLGPVDLLVSAGERIALVGPNGSGKTTLLGMFLGTIELQDGRRRLGPSVVVGELDQRRLGLDTNRSVADAFARRCDLTASEARSVLAKFGLSARHVRRTADTLSPGERTRAQLAEFAVRGVNLLVLDEPTNHLDLPAIEQLEQALVGYDGTLLLVTHDRAMLDSVTLTRTIRLPLTPPPT
jgi:ATPase subunit of ABC transporter with duplicated ATPase domains